MREPGTEGGVIILVLNKGREGGREGGWVKVREKLGGCKVRGREGRKEGEDKI